MTEEKLQQLRIASERKQRSRGPIWFIIGGVLAVTAVVAFFAIPRASDDNRAGLTSSHDKKDKVTAEASKKLLEAATKTSATVAGSTNAYPSASAGKVAGSILTVSGYIVNRERIELSPRFMGVVKWIGVKKGDSVTNGQTVVLLDDSEYRARLADIDGQIGVAQVAVKRAQTDLKRAQDLVASKVEMQKMLDDAQLQLESTEAQVKQIEGMRKLIETYLDWCVIKSPINGVVLEKLVDPNELVTPQTFGGTRGPSTSLIAVADPNDLQVEIDLNESDLAKISLGQRCKVSPEAYPDKVYDGVVAERAPEASRQKGTLQVKVQIRNPDKFLTPELSAKVDFLPAQ
ncbi:MAG TPA: efflux RND transporter periplasmic adaptor subunit [Candidatus Limnocylindria bacterium]|nr:efflux RND transporter periplasmic adaptor subunit [Candidatus Limnocylindria bacterium]